MPKVTAPKPEPLNNLNYSNEISFSKPKDIIKAMEAIANSNLNEEALIVLLANSTKLTQKTVKDVLNALCKLDEIYLKQK